MLDLKKKKKPDGLTLQPQSTSVAQTLCTGTHVAAPHECKNVNVSAIEELGVRPIDKVVLIQCVW